MKLEEIEEELTKRGIRVADGAPTLGDWASYSKDLHAVLISPLLTGSQRRAALMHELIHVRRGDDGHQDERTERAINREVAATLITPQDYARAEALHGPSTQAIAVELDVPFWVVGAYRETLKNSRERTLSRSGTP